MRHLNRALSLVVFDVFLLQNLSYGEMLSRWILLKKHLKTFLFHQSFSWFITSLYLIIPKSGLPDPNREELVTTTLGHQQAKHIFSIEKWLFSESLKKKRFSSESIKTSRPAAFQIPITLWKKKLAKFIFQHRVFEKWPQFEIMLFLNFSESIMLKYDIKNRLKEMRPIIIV